MHFWKKYLCTLNKHINLALYNYEHFYWNSLREFFI